MRIRIVLPRHLKQFLEKSWHQQNSSRLSVCVCKCVFVRAYGSTCLLKGSAPNVFRFRYSLSSRHFSVPCCTSNIPHDWAFQGWKISPCSSRCIDSPQCTSSVTHVNRHRSIASLSRSVFCWSCISPSKAIAPAPINTSILSG